MNIRNIIICHLVLASVLAVSSCGKSEAVVTGMTISVDKTQIESDGKDMAVFTVKDSEGNVLTVEDNMEAISFKNVATGKRLPRYSTGFTSIVDGEYEFVGIYGGVETENSVRITSSNRADYEVFHRNVALFKLTGTWCSACPGMTTALHALDDDAKAHSVILACHNEEKGHPFRLSYGDVDLASAIFLHMGDDTPAYPTVCYDMVSLNSARSTVTISEEIMSRRIDEPASVGIKISSMNLDGTVVKVSATVRAGEAGSYDMACALLADNLEYAGGFAADGIYDDVVCAVSGNNFLSYTPSTLFELAADEEFTREFALDFGTVPSEDKLADLKAVILVHRKNEDSGSSVNNCAVCRWGTTVDYKYN